MTSENTKRILIIDDSTAIHRDFRRVLCPPTSPGHDRLALLEEELLGAGVLKDIPREESFEVDSAFQGQEGVAKVERALEQGRPYSLVILDYRMPPGWNGVETLRRLRQVDPALPVVLCSAYSDYSWEEIRQEFGESPLLSELRKPCDGRELRQKAQTLSEMRESDSVM
ncbi:response regulator [Hyalangium versicolor]|uniref:response regulator n=1 Tax=Hyalangium versicolor TaxID=2861190 RepID=UPI001CCADE48|nr:response regulator [Hyalangium versicolor]